MDFKSKNRFHPLSLRELKLILYNKVFDIYYSMMYTYKDYVILMLILKTTMQSFYDYDIYNRLLMLYSITIQCLTNNKHLIYQLIKTRIEKEKKIDFNY